jgi:hypothetical protein
VRTECCGSEARISRAKAYGSGLAFAILVICAQMGTDNSNGLLKQFWIVLNAPVGALMWISHVVFGSSYESLISVCLLAFVAQWLLVGLGVGFLVRWLSGHFARNGDYSRMPRFCPNSEDARKGRGD